MSNDTPRPESNVTEDEIQRAYAEIANEECLTILPVPGHLDRAYVPDHWRERATVRALAAREQTLREELDAAREALARVEADLAARPGQLERLSNIADAVDRIARGETR